MNKYNLEIEEILGEDGKAELLSFLAHLVSFQTTKGEELPNMPFGEQNAKCLDCYLKKGEEMGFASKNIDGYAGHVEWKCGKKDAKLFAVLGHLDVVPAGEGWETPPFQLTKKDGKLFGRGVQDDKGAMAIALFCLKKLKDMGYVPNKDIRLIVGCNEENGSTCVEHYFTKERMPDVGISPDSDFPAIHSEKGIVWVGGEMEMNLCQFPKICGGEKMNMVPFRATADYVGEKNAEFFQNIGLEMHCEKGRTTVCATGKNAHGSTPEMGENAISKLILAIAEMLAEDVKCSSCKGNSNWQKLEFLKLLASDCNGKAVGTYCEDDVSGNLTQNLGVIDFQNGKLTFGIDIRYPNCTSVEDILEKLQKSSPADCKFSVINAQKKLFVSPQDPLVKLCVETYNARTGENAVSKKIGGGTYARELKYGIAVGPVFDGVDTTIHNKNECMTEFEFFKTTEILFEIIAKIASEDFPL